MDINKINYLKENIGELSIDLFESFLSKNKYEPTVLSMFIEIISDEFKRINSLKSERIKNLRKNELTKLLFFVLNSDLTLTDPIIIKKIEDIEKIVDVSLEGKIQTILQLIYEENWKVEEKYIYEPFYVSGSDIKFHREGYLDRVVIKNVDNVESICQEMNARYKIMLNNKWEDFTMSSFTISHESSQQEFDSFDEQPIIQGEQSGIQEEEILEYGYETNGNNIWQLINPVNKKDFQNCLLTLSESNGFNITIQDIQGPFVEIISKHYESELQSKAGKEAIQRYQKYAKSWEAIFQKYGFPPLTALLSYTESRVLSNVESEAKAKGYFQFLPGTAQRFGLKVDNNIDERVDPIKSAEAAAKLLRYQFDMRLSYQKYFKHKDKISQTKEHIIQKGDNLDGIARKYKVDREVLMDYNNITNPSSLSVGSTIKIPLTYSLSSKEMLDIETDCYYLSLASYNGNLAKRLNIVSYSDYLKTIAELISLINKYSKQISYVINHLKQSNTSQLDFYIDGVISIYQEINSYFKKEWKCNSGKWERIFDYKINQLKGFKKIKSSKEKKDKFISALYSSTNSDDPHLKVWFDVIISQNLFYPPNLFAIQKVYEKFGYGKNIQNEPMPIMAQNKPDDGYKEYIVKQGETLYRIAKNSGVNIDRIVRVSESSVLQVGEIIYIPEKNV